MRLIGSCVFMCAASLMACKDRNSSGTALATTTTVEESASVRLATCTRLDNNKVMANSDLTVFREPTSNQIRVYDQLAGLLIPGEFEHDPLGQSAKFKWAPVQGEVRVLSFKFAGEGVEEVTNSATQSQTKTSVKCKVDR